MSLYEYDEELRIRSEKELSDIPELSQEKYQLYCLFLPDRKTSVKKW